MLRDILLILALSNKIDTHTLFYPYLVIMPILQTLRCSNKDCDREIDSLILLFRWDYLSTRYCNCLSQLSKYTVCPSITNWLGMYSNFSLAFKYNLNNVLPKDVLHACPEQIGWECFSFVA